MSFLFSSMAPSNSEMLLVIDQIKSLKRLNYGSLQSHRMLNLINPHYLHMYYEVSIS